MEPGTVTKKMTAQIAMEQGCGQVFDEWCPQWIRRLCRRQVLLRCSIHILHSTFRQLHCDEFLNDCRLDCSGIGEAMLCWTLVRCAGDNVVQRVCVEFGTAKVDECGVCGGCTSVQASQEHVPNTTYGVAQCSCVPACGS